MPCKVFEAHGLERSAGSAITLQKAMPGRSGRWVSLYFALLIMMGPVVGIAFFLAVRARPAAIASPLPRASSGRHGPACRRPRPRCASAETRSALSADGRCLAAPGWSAPVFANQCLGCV